MKNEAFNELSKIYSIGEKSRKDKSDLSARVSSICEEFLEEHAPQKFTLEMLSGLYLELFRKAFLANDFKTSEKVLASLEKLILAKQSKDSKES